MLFGDILLDALLLLVEAHLATSCAYIAIVGIGHLTWTIDDAAHDGNLQSLEVRCGRLDAGDGLLQVVERTSTAGARDILRLTGAHTRCLQDVERRSINLLRSDVVTYVMYIQAVHEAIDAEHTRVGRRTQLQVRE